MSPKSEHVLRELLSMGFRAYPRALVNGLAFAALTAALLWPGLPHSFLLAWYATLAALAAARLALARSYLREAQPADQLERWLARAALGYAATGLAWGALGAAAILFAPGVQLYALWGAFVVALLAVLLAPTTGAHPLVFRSFILAGMAPIVVASIATPAPNYWLRLVAELLLLVVTLLVGRSANRYVVDSIAMRYENIELLGDLTRQKQELDSANVAKTRFLAAASHDLRQPMQAIALLVESLQERVHEHGAREIVESIRRSVVAMSALLNEILDISKFDAGVVKAQASVFPIARLLDRLRGSFGQTAAQRGLLLRIRPCAAVIETDEVLLYRILVNLVDNALRYTEKGGVLIGCRQRARGLRIEVWDTGIGIPGDEIENIFREFYQLGNPQRDRAKGLGLGLATVERMARALELSIEVRSRLRRGSVFSVVVPYGDPARIRAIEPRAAEGLDGCAVLVIENDNEIRAAMARLLEGWHCKVATASSASDIDNALATLGSAPDAIVADFRLPGEANGLDIIARVRARHPEASAVLVTGDVAPEALREAQAAGYPVLHKPVRPAKLRSLLGAALRERRRREETVPAAAKEPT